MCFYDADAPVTFHATNVKKARTDHRCCECRQTIPSGSSYEKVKGIWPDFGPHTFKTCNACVALRAEVQRLEEAAGCYGSEAIPPFEMLLEAAQEEELICVLPRR